MKVVFVLSYLIVQITIIHASNQYLGCFIDQIGNRDLSIFIGDYEKLTPKQCVVLCHEQNFPYAAIQYGNECRCGQQYGKYGQVPDDECDYLCSTSEKCGGDKRNSVYNVVTSLLAYNTDLDSMCQNNFIGYQGCFSSVSLTIGMDAVNSIEECIKRCAMKYTYAGIMNGNLCYCGNELNLPSSNSDLCNIRCSKSSNDLTSDCCGGLNVFSVYNIEKYRSDLFESIIRAADDITHTSSYTTDVRPTSTAFHTVTVTVITSQLLSTTSSSLPITSSFHSELTSSSHTNMGQSVPLTASSTNKMSTSVYPSSLMSSVTTTTPVSSTHILETLLTTSHISTSTASTLIVSNTMATSTSSISISQSSTNLIITTTNSPGSSSMRAVTSSTGIFSLLSIYTSENTGSSRITNTVTAVSTLQSTFTSQPSLHTDTSYQTSIGTVSSSNTISTQTASHMDTTNSISSMSLTSTITSNTPLVTLTSIHTDTTQSITPSRISEFSSMGSSQSTNSFKTETSLTSTMISIPISSQLVSTSTTYLSQTSTVSMTSTPLSTRSIATSSPSSFSTIITAESQRTSSITSIFSSPITKTVSEQSSSRSSIAATSFLSTNSLASSSTNIGTQITITSSSHTDLTNQTTTIMITNASSTSSPTTITITISTSQTTTVAVSYIISTVLIVPLSERFNPDSNDTRQSIRQKLIRIINLGFHCLANSSYPNCTQTRSRIKRQTCSNGYDVNLVSNITEISNDTSTKYITGYTVLDLCNSNALITPTQVKAATDKLSRADITRMLGYEYDGELIRSTSIITPENPTTDRKLWIIGAVLGPIVFAAVLIFLFCYLHYKCRPRQTNRTLAKTPNNAPLSARSTNNQIASNDLLNQKPPIEKSVHILTRNDPIVGVSTSFNRLTPTESEGSSDHTMKYPISTDIPMDEIRRQNDVEHWRNKLRLQEKFQQSSTGLQGSSIPNTKRSGPYQYNNEAFEHDRLGIAISPLEGMISNRSSGHASQSPEVEAGRTKLHRLLDEVLDKADSEESYTPDSEIERQKRRRQRRRINSISTDTRPLPLFNNTQQIPHIPVIPQVSERPDPSLIRLRYNPYEAGDRAHAISRLPPVELKPKYETDNDHFNQYSSRSNPPLFYDDSTIADHAATAIDAYATPKRYAKTRLETDQEAAMRHNGGHNERRQHKFIDDSVYIDSISKNQGQRRTTQMEPEMDTDLLRRNDYRDEYIMAKRSVLNTKNIISSIHDELQHIVFPKSEDYHA